MMKKIFRAAAAVMTAAVMLAGCQGAPGTGSGAYLKDFDAAKYVTLGQYTGLDINVDAFSIDDSDVAAYVSNYFSSLPKDEISDREAILGDTANIDYAGRLVETGEYFQGGTRAGYDLVLGSGTFIPGFEDGVVGMKIGESREIPLTFPEEYHSAELAGQDVIFEVTLNSLKAESDAGAAALGIEGVTDLESYRKYLEGEYKQQLTEQYRRYIENAVADRVISDSMFETPPAAMIDRLKSSYSSQIQQLADVYSEAYGQQISVSDILGYAMSNEGFTGDEDSYIESGAMDTANSYITMAAIAKENGITVSDDEVEKNMEENLQYSGYDTIEEYKKNADIEEIREQVLYDKVVDYLVENNNFVEEE